MANIVRDDLTGAFKYLRDELPRLLSDAIVKNKKGLTECVNVYFDRKPVNKFSRNKGKYLRALGGPLAQSMRIDDPNNIFAVYDTQEGVVIEYGSKLAYADIHEFGGMAGRHRKAKIPARPYQSPALELFNDRYMEQILNKILEDNI